MEFTIRDTQYQVQAKIMLLAPILPVYLTAKFTNFKPKTGLKNLEMQEWHP